MLTRALRSCALALLLVCLAASSVVWAAPPAPKNQPPSLRHAFIVADEPSAVRPAPAAPQSGAGVRLVVNTFDPNVVADGRCSLIEALLNANADSAVSPDCAAGSGPDTVLLRPGTYTLTQVYEDMDGGNGLPAVTSDITLHGHGATVARSADPSAPAFRIFRVASGETLTLRDLTISHGLANQGFGDGGLRNLGGKLRLLHCVVRDNRAETFPDNNLYTYGAGVYNREGTLLVSQSTFEENVVSNGYAAGIYAIDSQTVVRQSAFVHNTATSDYDYLGGAVGLFNVAGSNASTMRIEDSVISDNVAVGNDLAAGGLGNAGSANVTASLLLVNSTVARNSAAYGAGIWSTVAGWPEPHTVTLTDRSTISNNTAASQGSGYADGGAVENFASTLIVANSTISGNTATGVVDGFGQPVGVE